MTKTQLDQQVEKIRDKVLAKSHKYAGEDRLILKEVYFEVTKLTGRARELKDDCDSCIITANQIIGNYINYHMARPEKKAANVIVVKTDTKPGRKPKKA